MFRTTLPFAIILAVPFALDSAPRLRTADASHPVGKWRVEFSNGVVQASENKLDGPAWVTEPGRTSPGKWKVEDRQIIIRFDDDRLERWTKKDDRWQVEHWCPSAAFPNDPPVFGLAKLSR